MSTLGRKIARSLTSNAAGLAAPLLSFNNRLSLLIFILPVLVLVDLGWSSEEVDQFWRELGLSQNPDDLLRDILARREFQESYWKTLISSLIKWFLELITRLLRRLWGAWDVDIETDMLWTAVGAFFAVALAAAVLTALFLALKSFLSRKRTIAELAAESSHVAESCSKLRDLSSSLANRGEYGEALIHLFRYALVRLDEQGRLRFYTGKTNREILRSRQLKKSDREILSEMVPVFNSVRYGNFPCGKTEYDRFLLLTGRLVDASEVS